MLVVLPAEGVLERQRRLRRLGAFDKPVDERRLADALAADQQQVPLRPGRLGHRAGPQLLLLLADGQLPDVVRHGCSHAALLEMLS